MHLLGNGRTISWVIYSPCNPGLDYAFYVITLQHAKSLSLNTINSSISIWKKNTTKENVNLCHSQRDNKATCVQWQYLT
jgi:hypothetical protein